MRPDTHIIIFAKAPLAGFAKTRLIPVLGESGAAELAQRLFYQAIEQALAAGLGSVELCMTPGPDDPCWKAFKLADSLLLSSQGEGGLGERMARASERALQQNNAVLLMGTDCPGLTSSVLQQAASMLKHYDSCMVPVSDGGYALLGLTRFDDALFWDIPWSTSQVSCLTRERIQSLNWTLAELEELHDIDEADDLKFLPEENK
jgi:rSAM/selenodomain-associated transferase 1